jgi:hypothetical protein
MSPSEDRQPIFFGRYELKLKKLIIVKHLIVDILHLYNV